MPAGSDWLRGACALSLLAAAAGAHADYKQTYSRGLAALKDGDYAEARQLFAQALAEESEPAMRVRLYGQRWEPYLPQHYLGLAAFKLGDCATAQAQWSSAASQKIAAQLADIRDEQQRDLAECGKTAVAQKPEAPRPAAPAPAPAPAPAEAPAEKPVAKAPPPPPAPKPATEPPPKPVVAEKPPAPESVPSRTPPRALLDAFDRYLAGRYADLQGLDPAGYRDPRARYHAFLLRAAARFTLAELGGGDELLDAARADARAAHAADARAAPDAVLFSPRFRAFYAQNR